MGNKSLIQKANDAYCNMDPDDPNRNKALIDDTEYDSLRDSMLIEKANDAYYNTDEKILTDSEFDLMMDNGLGITNFRNKTEHDQPMGSLKKIKTEKAFDNWCQGNAVKISPKLDGNSIEIIVEDGKFIKGVTRGDGFVGNDISDKIVHCNIMHTPELATEGHYSLKCEAIMKKEYQKDYDKNIRNVVGGILNRKSIMKKELAKIDIIPFDELDFTIGNMTYDEIAAGYKLEKELFEYDIDGLVVELVNHIHAEKKELLPENLMAVKFNKDGVPATVGDHEWTLGKHSKLTPVIILEEGVEIDGTTVKRVSASNWSLLIEAGLGIGAKIEVIKSGDIIPFISKVVEPSDDIKTPHCPVCDTKAVFDDNLVQAICPNIYCEGRQLVFMQHIFEVFDLDYISDSTVEKLYAAGNTLIPDFFNLTVHDIENIPGFGEKKARNIIYQLKNVKLSEAKVLKCAMVPGISESNGQRIIDHFNSLEMFYLSGAGNFDYTIIDDFGEKTDENIKENFHRFMLIKSAFEGNVEILKAVKKVVDGVNIIFTGKCDQYNRKELTKFLTDNNYNVQKSMNKKTEILLTADVNSNSSKTKKAEKLGIKILSYDDFFANIGE